MGVSQVFVAFLNPAPTFTERSRHRDRLKYPATPTPQRVKLRSPLNNS
ncbi:MAG: hypothetical protein SW833_20890 [Cyanobacteriota bacterium]|nr:hypothetical protein [Cyanobacteriota bacterium]